jgi:hypothetical protein
LYYYIVLNFFQGLLEGEPEEFREFHNLRTLILIECNIGDRCQVLWYVLQNVPNLERLVLQDCEVLYRLPFFIFFLLWN